MQQARLHLEKQGFEVVFQARVNNGKVDVLGIKKGERVAIECQVTPNWKIFVSKVKRYKPYLSKLILAIPKNVRPRLAPEGIEVVQLDVEKYRPKRFQIVLPDDLSMWLRKKALKKGGISKIVEGALRKQQKEEVRG